MATAHADTPRIETVDQVRLEAEGAGGRTCYYELALERITDGWLVHKRSGTEGRKPHEERWFRAREDAARDLFERIVSEKLRDDRRSPRRYRPTQRRPRTSRPAPSSTPESG